MSCACRYYYEIGRNVYSVTYINQYEGLHYITTHSDILYEVHMHHIQEGEGDGRGGNRPLTPRLYSPRQDELQTDGGPSMPHLVMKRSALLDPLLPYHTPPLPPLDPPIRQLECQTSFKPWHHSNTATTTFFWDVPPPGDLGNNDPSASLCSKHALACWTF